MFRMSSFPYFYIYVYIKQLSENFDLPGSAGQNCYGGDFLLTISEGWAVFEQLSNIIIAAWL